MGDYTSAYVIMAHGEDNGTRTKLPAGVCVVTFMQCGSVAHVFGQVDRAYQLFQNSSSVVRNALMNPGEPRNKTLIERRLFGGDSGNYQITVSEGDNGDFINDYRFTLYLAGPEDGDDGDDVGWVVKSGLYKYPIHHSAGRYIITQGLNPERVTDADVVPAFRESLYPTEGQMRTLFENLAAEKGRSTLEFFDVQNGVTERYPLSIWDIIKQRRGLSGTERIVIFNPVCRDFKVKHYQLRKSTLKSHIARARANSGEQQQRRARQGLSFTLLRPVPEEQNEPPEVNGLVSPLARRRSAKKAPSRASANPTMRNNRGPARRALNLVRNGASAVASGIRPVVRAASIVASGVGSVVGRALGCGCRTVRCLLRCGRGKPKYMVKHVERSWLNWIKGRGGRRHTRKNKH